MPNVTNNPVSLTDPSGLAPADWNPRLSGDLSPNCSIDGGAVGPCEMFGGLFGSSDSTATCPNNDCSGLDRRYTGNYGGSYSLVAAVNGLTWINNYNGEEISSDAAAEIGLGDPGSGLPGNLPPGTPQKYWGPFQQGFNAALKDLKKKKCGKFYGGQGPATMNATQYRFLDLGNTNVGAETVSPSSVFINSAGPYMTFSPVPGQAGPFGLYWTQPQFQAFILLHELGHQLSPITGFQPDAGSPLNQAQSMQVIGACF